MPDLSIIIPHYNTPHLLKKLLDSIPALDNVQVIVVDDNSNQDIGIYNELHASHPHVTYLANGTGKNSPGICRNIGINHAKGQWLLFADADDYFTEGFYDIIKEHFASDADIIYFTPSSVDIATGKEATRHIYYKKLIHDYLSRNDRLAELRLRFEHTGPVSKLIRGECVTQNAITFGDTLINEDAVFSIKLGSCARKILASYDTIYCITANTGSLSTRVTKEYEAVRLNLYNDRYHFLKQHLSKEDFKLLDLSGLPFIISAILHRHGVKTTYQVFSYLKKNKIRIIGRRWFKISHWRWKIKEYRNNKKYYPVMEQKEQICNKMKNGIQ